MQQRRHERTDDQRNADGHSNAQRHAEVAHGETVTHIANAPHGSKEGDLQKDVRPYRGIKGWKARKQQQAHRNRQQNP